MGTLDFAGGTVVISALGFLPLRLPWSSAGAVVWSRAHATASLPLTVAGNALLWFGWFGFNAEVRCLLAPSYQCLHRHEYRCRFSRPVMDV
jgi:ammonia channel protein AmtB